MSISKSKLGFSIKIKKATVSDTPETISYSPKTNSFLESEIFYSKQNLKSFDENNSSINLDNNNKQNSDSLTKKLILENINEKFSLILEPGSSNKDSIQKKSF